jgi:hypothetical protein
MVTYRFNEYDIDQLAGRISQALAITLYPQQSPMIGRWYSDIDLQPIVKAIREGQPPPIPRPGPRFELVPNDPEPGYTPPTILGGGHCLLQIHADPAELPDIEAKLRQAGLTFKRRK